MRFPLEGFFRGLEDDAEQRQYDSLPLPLCVLSCASAPSLALSYCAYAARREGRVMFLCPLEVELPQMPCFRWWSRVGVKYLCSQQELCDYLLALQPELLPELLVVAELHKYARSARQMRHLLAVLRSTLALGDTLGLAYTSEPLGTESAQAVQAYASLYEPR